jgi:dienelactone hydrolase
MDMLVFLDQKTLREGPLYALGGDRFVSGPTLAVPYPFVIEARFRRAADGSVAGLRWSEGGKEVAARRIAPHRVEQVSIAHGDVTLKGSLTLPDGPGPHPAVVFAHGSGPATRDVAFWNMYFVRLGMAVLSLDKRGAGESTGDWTKASFDDIAGDWLAGVEMLKQRKDIDAKRIGVHGSSQGGWTAPLMAARSPDIAFVIVRAGSGVNLVDTMVHEIGWSARDAGAPEAVALEAEAAARTMFAFATRNAPWPEVQAYVATQKGKPSSAFAWPLNWSEGGWGYPWARSNGGYDATDSLRKTRVPVLWYLADLDHNVPSDASAKRLLAVAAESGHPDFQLKRLPRTGHGFIDSATGSNNEYHLATHFAAGYFDTMESWLRERGFVR